MKIIEIGICIDNNDPRGIGRVRASNIDEIDSARQNSIQKWTPWSKNDPFIYTPFLPNHINIVPKVGQALKIIRYDNERELQNQEYIAGPFTTPHDFGSQIDEQQITETTYGQRSKKTPDIKSFTDKKLTEGFVKKESIGAIPRLDDIAISSNYGSDILLTEHGINLRAGKLITKDFATDRQKQELQKYPFFSTNMSRLTLKKYPETYRIENKTITQRITPKVNVNLVIEYSLDSLVAPSVVTFSFFKNTIKNDKFDISSFNINTSIESNYSLILLKEYELITNNKLKEAEVLIRDTLFKIENSPNLFGDKLISDSFYPFYFRPTISLRELPLSNTFLSKIVYLGKVTNGLIFSKTDIEPVEQIIEKNIEYLAKSSNKEQSFASLNADKLFIFSNETVTPDDKKIDLNLLNKYEYTQEDYLLKILPNTFSVVRGEKLLEIIEIIVEILLNHKHGILTEPKYYRSTIETLKNLIGRAKQDVLNNSIRIN